MEFIFGIMIFLICNYIIFLVEGWFKMFKMFLGFLEFILRLFLSFLNIYFIFSENLVFYFYVVR